MAEVNIPKKDYKVWAIVATSIAGVLVIATAVLITLAVVNKGATVQDSEKPVASAETNNEEGNGTTTTSGLDGSQLITEADLDKGEIPDHYIGNKDSKVVVIEYEDFACSHCQALQRDAEQIHAEYQDRVLFIHRSFSLGFPNSKNTISAAEAAYRLGGEKAYWAMNKLLYQDSRWTADEVFGSQSVLNGFAKEIGLDTAKFEKAMSDTQIANKITRDKELGKKASVTGTPTWIINGEQVTALDVDIRTALDAAL